MVYPWHIIKTDSSSFLQACLEFRMEKDHWITESNVQDRFHLVLSKCWHWTVKCDLVTTVWYKVIIHSVQCCLQSPQPGTSPCESQMHSAGYNTRRPWQSTTCIRGSECQVFTWAATWGHNMHHYYFNIVYIVWVPIWQYALNGILLCYTLLLKVDFPQYSHIRLWIQAVEATWEKHFYSIIIIIILF